MGKEMTDYAREFSYDVKDRATRSIKSVVYGFDIDGNRFQIILNT